MDFDVPETATKRSPLQGMSKRKREDDEDSTLSSITDRALRIKASRLQVRVDRGIKALSDGLKLAKAFDRQKMSRRQQKAGTDKQKLERLRQEVEVLKNLEASKTAKNYLMKQMVKTKRISQSAAFIALYGEDVRIAPSSGLAEANVLGRLFKSNPVQEVLPDVMKSIYDVLGLLGKATKSVNETIVSNEQSQREEFPKISKTSTDASADAFEGFSDDPKIERGPGYDHGTTLIFGNNPEAHESTARRVDTSSHGLARDPDPDSSIRGNSLNKDDMEITTEEESNEEDEDAGSDDISLYDDDDDGREIQPTQRTSKPGSLRSTVSTAFLPTLSMGGYYSGSESGSENGKGYDPDSAYKAVQPQPRKNRRGQRERQKIAEKKYGASAKHLKNRPQQQGKPVRNSGWDPKRGAVLANGERSGFRGNGGGNRSGFEPTGANADVVQSKIRTKPKSDTTSKAMHPSWEAARKRKLESQGSNALFSGKKITFD